MSAGAVSGQNEFEVVDCTFENGTTGMTVSGSIRAQVDRCRMTGNQDGVVLHAALGTVSAALRDCLIAKNNRHGLIANMFGALGNVILDAKQCTIAGNTQTWIGSVGSGSTAPAIRLENVLCWGNGADYSSPIGPTSSFTQIGGPDPLFRDPANGDYRVNFGSPVIDAGDPATPIGALDLDRVPRSIDGDLDTHERADVGCNEFQPLALTTTGQQGTLLAFESFGSTLGTSMLRLSRGPLASPMPTPFGEFDLGPAVPWTTVPTAPGPGALLQRPIPASPIFIGQTYSFQGLVSSSASPSGAAWSNAVSFTIIP